MRAPRRLRPLCALAGACLWLLGCSLQPRPEAVALPPIVAPSLSASGAPASAAGAAIENRSTGDDQRAYELSAQVNARRSGAGRPVLRWNATLYRAALARARALAAPPACWLPDPDGCLTPDAFAQRLQAGGYDFDRALELSHVGVEGTWTPTAVVTAWGQVDPHQQRLQDRIVDEIGAAVVRAGPLTLAVVVLGRRRPSSDS